MIRPSLATSSALLASPWLFSYLDLAMLMQLFPFLAPFRMKSDLARCRLNSISAYVFDWNDGGSEDGA